MTGALITAVGGVLTAMITILVGYFVKRTDRVAKLTQANMADQAWNLELMGALRDDYWGLSDWSYSARSRFNQLRSHPAVASLPDAAALDPMPTPRHRVLEKRHTDTGGKE